jgi:putative nucleotidyltransferase with HDIG domain
MALRAELRALRTTRAPVTTTRVVVLCEGDAGDRVVAAATRRGFAVVRVARVAELEARIGGGNVDVVVVAASLGEPALREVARLMGSIDEATALVLVADASSSAPSSSPGASTTAALTLAFTLGASDCLVAPLPDELPLSVRLERAAARPREKRDLRRLTYELVVANGHLALERQRVEDGQVKLLNGLVRALEARDPYTAGHTDRVAALSLRCGEECGLNAAQLHAVRIGALLHDVGKIGIRDEVLYKPGRLTHDEFAIIKTHTSIGARILDGIDSLACALPIVRGHHEKLDGNGYPDGLRGDAIAKEVRVVSASDVLDAITSTRPYRGASTIEEAFEIMAPMTGDHLDPEIVGTLRALHTAGRLADLLLQR